MIAEGCLRTADTKSISRDKVDPELIAMIGAEAKFVGRLAAACREAAKTAIEQTGLPNVDLLEVEIEHVVDELRARHEVVRASLIRKYDKPFPALPPSTIQAAEKTLSVWNELNKTLIALNKKTEACEEKLKAIPHIDPLQPLQERAALVKKKRNVCENMADAYLE